MASSTCVVELESQVKPTNNNHHTTIPGTTLQTTPDHSQIEVLASSTSNTDTPSSAVTALEKWNHPRSNVYRTFATFWSFFVMGANDAAYGVSNQQCCVNAE